MKTIDYLKKELVGKKLSHKNSYGRLIDLEIEDVQVKHNHRQITPDTQANDWYGESSSWDTIEVCFVDGSRIEVGLDTDLAIILN